jgi:hypothetical protein
MNKRSRDLDYLDHIANRIRRIRRVTASVDLAGFVGNEDNDEPERTQDADPHQDLDQ